jgi:hypothetical protein
VGGIRSEPAHVRERVLQPREHAVQRLREVVQLVAGSAQHQALGEVLGGDPASGAGHRPDGLQRRAGEPGAARRRQTEAERHEHGERLQVGPERPVHVVEGHADLDEPRRPALPQRDGQQPEAIAAVDDHRLERRLAALAARPCVRGHRELQRPERL